MHWQGVDPDEIQDLVRGRIAKIYFMTFMTLGF
jgi:hypothetical protein